MKRVWITEVEMKRYKVLIDVLNVVRFLNLSN